MVLRTVPVVATGFPLPEEMGLKTSDDRVFKKCILR